MLTRLKVSGFKNLVETEIRFGPFTCIAGYNGVGKSNVFDAIRFLSLLADETFERAARQTRGGGDPASLFTAWGDRAMRFECDLVVPRHGKDEFYQPAEASHTYLTYSLELKLESDVDGQERIRLHHEELSYVPNRDARRRLGFPASREWQESVVATSHRRASYIETIVEGDQRRIRLSADKMRDERKTKRGGGRPTDFLAETLPRTVLSAASHSEEARTAVLVRAEMRSWRNLQLEPSSLRLPDDLHAPSSLTPEGKHLPATLNRLASGAAGERLLAEVSNRLAQLVEDVQSVRVVRDETRRALQLVLTDTGGQEFTAASLSDGTLRFVALSVLERDVEATGVFCLEEPENGIHPERIGVMMRLLADMATDVDEPAGDDNPLQQVIISTHSPVVVAHTRPDDLLFADHRAPPNDTPAPHRALVLRPCERTWRVGDDPEVAVAKGSIIRYFGSLSPQEEFGNGQARTTYGAVAEQLDMFGRGA